MNCKVLAFAAMTSVGATAFADVYQWQPVDKIVSYGWAEARCWTNGVAPVLAAGHEIDFSADTVQTGNGYGQAIERIKLANTSTAGFSFSSIYGPYGRWLTMEASCLNPIPTATIGNPNDFFGLWALNVTYTFNLGATESFTPVIQRFSTKGNITFNVPTAGTAVIVSNVTESGTISKSGAGRLKVTHPAGNTAHFRVSEGTLQVEGARQYTTAEVEAVMAKAAFHVDASQVASVRTNASGRVTKWCDVRGEAGYTYGRQLVQNGYTLPLPTIAKGYQNGLDVMDFGPYAPNYTAATNTGTSCTLYFDDSAWFNRGIYVAEAIVVEGLHDATAMPACLFAAYNDKGLRRTANPPELCLYNTYADSVPVASGIKQRNLNARDGDWGINGRKVLPSTLWTNDTMCVFSLRSRDAKTYMRINCWGADYGTNPGGIRVGEALYFTNHLTYAERKNVIRYLQKKWGCTDDGAEDMYDVGLLQDTAGKMKLDMSEDLAVREILVKGSSFEKTGKGSLEVGAVRTFKTGADVPVTVSGGTLTFGPYTQPSANPKIAAGSYRHYDASDETSFTYTTAEDGVRQVTEWHDQSGDTAKVATRVAATAGTKSVPSYPLGYPTLIANGLNGLSTLSFGTSCSVSTNLVIGSAAMCFDATLSAKWDQDTDKHLRTVFMVCRRPNVARSSWLLGGTCVDTPSVSFHPNGTILWRDCFAHPNVLGGETAVNGVPIDGLVADSSLNQYHLLRVSLVGNVTANTFALDRNGTATDVGGIDLAEVVLYDRPLSRQETVDTEAYLLKKWFNQEHPNCNVSHNAALTLTAAAEPELTTERDLAVDTLTVANTAFTKKGAGKLTVNQLAGSIQNLAVEAGELDISLDDNQPLFHFDASKADSFTTFTTPNADESLRTNIAVWADTRANGLMATPIIKYAAITNPALIQVQTRPNVWRPAVDFGKYRAGTNSVSDGMTAGLGFSKRFTNVREVFTIHSDAISSHDAFLFCDLNNVDYHRGGGGELISSKWTTIANEPNTLIYVDGVAASYATCLTSGQWYLINIAREKDTAVSQMSLDRANDSYRCGGMRCCEQLGFSQALTPERRNYITRLMQYKWFAEGTPPVWTNTTLNTLSLSGDAVLSLADRDYLTLQTFTSSTGTLKGGVVLKDGATWNVTAVRTVEEACAITEALGNAGAVTVVVTPCEDTLFNAVGRYPLARVGTCELDLAQMQVVMPARFHKVAKLEYEDGVIYIRILPRGLVINFR